MRTRSSSPNGSNNPKSKYMHTNPEKPERQKAKVTSLVLTDHLFHLVKAKCAQDNIGVSLYIRKLVCADLGIKDHLQARKRPEKGIRRDA